MLSCSQTGYMRLLFLVTLTMIAFAGNSVLNRLAVAEFGMGVWAFAVVRVAAGAVTLAVLVRFRRQHRSPIAGGNRWAGALALAAYMLGFSYAYQTLEAGTGALILFGVLQLLLFGWTIWTAAAVNKWQWAGMTVSLIGLAVLLWPTDVSNVPMAGVLAMLGATVGWAAYTILGRSSTDPLKNTADNFALCLPLVAIMLLFDFGHLGAWQGIACALCAGALTSGLGYALWYRCLPQLSVPQAALAQLSVPLLAVFGGVVLLSEPVTSRMMVAAALILGGIGLSIGSKAPVDRS